MEGIRLNIRLILLSLLTVFLLILLAGRLTNMQLVHGTVWIEQTETTTTRTVTEIAGRGDILDRYGRPLVSSRMVYAVTIDYEQMIASEDPAAGLLALARAAMNAELAYTDEFPVTLPPFSYTEMNAEQKKRLENYLVKNNWPSDADAIDLMDLIREKFSMGDEYSDYDARLAAGLLYETDMRFLASAYPAPYIYVPPYVFARNVSMELISLIYEQGYGGARVYVDEERVFNTEAAAHILGRTGRIFAEDYETYRELGYSGDEVVGVDGAEKAFESYLRGTAGTLRQTFNEDGRLIGSERLLSPVAGNNVYLSLDIYFQEQVERLLAEGIHEMQTTGVHLKGLEAEAGSAVVMDIHTGEVLAMANFPTYSLQRFSEDYEALKADPLTPLLNRAIAGTYAPGSTFKMVTGAAGMAKGLVTPETTIRAYRTYTHFKDYQPRCSADHGHINLANALRVSCNYYFFDVGLKSGISALNEWAARFGLGVLSGIELEGEKAGYIAGPDTSAAFGASWYQGNVLSAAIGQQNNMFTPLQLANYVATIANGGTLYRPRALKEVRDYKGGRSVFFGKPDIIHEIGLTAEEINALQEGMTMVTNPGGTANSVFRDCDITVAGKTGTVQTDDQPNNGVFVCYAPADNPQIAVSVVIQKGGGGSRVAFIAKNIIEAYFALQEEYHAGAA